MSLLEQRKRSILKFHGPMVAAATPFDSNGSLDVKQIQPYAEHLAQIGVKGVYILGTTGESYALTLAERIALVEQWSKALEHVERKQSIRLVSIVNVSAMSIMDIIELAKVVEKSQRFDGIALLQPLFYMVQNEKQMVAYAKQVLDSTNGQLPLLYYHFPTFTGVPHFQLESFAELALQKLPQFCAMKFTETDIVKLGIMQKRFGDRCKMFVGYDQALLAGKASFDIDAGICATFSFKDCVENYTKMLNSVDSGDIKQAQQCQHVIHEFCVKLRSEGNFFMTLKKLLDQSLAQKSIHFGQPRLPIYIDTKNI